MTVEQLPINPGDWSPLNDFLAVGHNRDGTIGGSQTFLPASNGTDDTTALQAILDNAGNIAGKKGESYKISGPLVLKSNTTLDMTGCTVTLNAGSNCNMVQSQAAYGTGRDSDIHILGGLWDRQNNDGTTARDRHSIVLRKVDRCSVRDASFTSTGGKFALLFQNTTEFIADNLWMRATASDGVHVEGPAARGTISNIRGSCGDDMVAITAKDYAAYVWGDEGDVTDILIDGVFANATSRRIVGVIGGNGLNTKRITVRNVHGSTSLTSVIEIGDDAGDANTQGGLLDEILVDGVRAISTNNSGTPLRISASLGKKISVRDLTWNAGAATLQHGIVVQGTSVDSLNISGIQVPGACGNNGSAVAVVAGGVVNELSVANVTGTFDNGSGSAVVYIVGTVNDLAVTGVTGSGAGGILQTIVKLDDATATATARRVAIANVAMTTVGSSILRAINAAHVLTSVAMVNVLVNSVSWLVDTAATTKISLANVRVPTGAFNVRTGGVVTVFADASCDLPASTATGTLIGPGLASKKKATPTYSASITPVSLNGEWQTITVTNGTAFTINAPSSPPSSTTTQRLTIEILNSSGGAMGVITWDAAFVFAGATWANPASTKKRFARFEWNGAAWVCTGVASADY